MSLLSQQYTEFSHDSDDNLRLLIESTKEYHSEYIQENPDWWWQLSDDELIGILTEHLMNYDGDERDLIWWSWRLRLANELDQ